MRQGQGGGGSGEVFVAVQVERYDNGSLVAAVVPSTQLYVEDDSIGALCYVVVIIILYACSILMMIASYIRKNREDQRLKRYLKEMAFVRKREMRLTVLTAASRARQLANTDTTRHKTIHEPETHSADDKLSSLSSLPAAMMAEIKDGGDTCRKTAKLVDNDAREMAPSLVTTPQPIRSQSDECGHVEDVSLAETPSSECVYYNEQCPQTDDTLTHSYDRN